jgi:hypothetical protein
MKHWILFSLVVLGGCYSFNNVEIHTTEARQPIISSQPTISEEEEIPLPEIPIEKKPGPRIPDGLNCPAFVMPELAKTPPLPLKELSNISPLDTAALDAIQQRHIEELRLHILKVKRTVRTAYRDYLISCKKSS